jgi:hypothetical protein
VQLPIVLEFDPALACNVPECDRIELINVVRLQKSIGGGARVPWTWQEVLAWGARGLYYNQSAFNDYFVDEFPGAGDPYWTGNDPDDFLRGHLPAQNPEGHGYKLCEQMLSARADDPPNIPNWLFPTGATTVFAEMETCAYCSAGPGQGVWLGCVRWEYQRPLGGVNRPGFSGELAT